MRKRTLLLKAKERKAISVGKKDLSLHPSIEASAKESAFLIFDGEKENGRSLHR